MRGVRDFVKLASNCALRASTTSANSGVRSAGTTPQIRQHSVCLSLFGARVVLLRCKLEAVQVWF